MKWQRYPYLTRSIRSWGTLIFTIFVVLGIVIFLEIVTFNHNIRLDLTSAKIYSLSDQTIKILKTLNRDIHFTVFYRQGERKIHDDLLKRFSSYSPYIKYSLIDLDRNPGQARVNEITAYGQTIVESDGKKKMIVFLTEEAIINTILKLTRQRERYVYFTIGHGEKEPKGDYSALNDALEAEGWQIKTTNLATKERISSRDSVLVIGGPKNDFFDHELQLLSQTIQEGGKVIFLIEPFTSIPRLKKFLEQYQILVGDDIIVDKEHKLMGGDYLTPLIPYFTKSPITNTLESPALFPTAKSVEVKKKVESGILTVHLAMSSAQSWTKREQEVKKGEIEFKKGVDKQGPISVAVVVKVSGIEESKPGGEIVCFGDSDFISNKFFEIKANKDFFLNTVDWLAREEDLISIRPKKYEYPFHYMTKEQGRWAFLIPVILLPAVSLVTGVIVFLHRKSRS